MSRKERNNMNNKTIRIKQKKVLKSILRPNNKIYILIHYNNNKKSLYIKGLNDIAYSHPQYNYNYTEFGYYCRVIVTKNIFY